MINVEIKVPKLGYNSAESYKSLRANLQFCGDDKKVLAITSCTPNEGKSSVTLNLAVSLAESGKKSFTFRCRFKKVYAIRENKNKRNCEGYDTFFFRTSGN